jgi:hypothetical protein
MKNLLVLLFVLINFSNSNGINTKTLETKEPAVEIPTITLDTVEITAYTDVKPVENLLDKVPVEQRDSFVAVLREFATERGFDWRVCLLVLYQESGLNPQMEGLELKSFVGIAMFGSAARKELGVTRSELLKMNHLQQVKLAVKMWEMNERQKGVKVDGFLKLHLCNFYPIWLKYADRGGILPAPKKVKKANSALLSSNGEFTVNGLLGFYRNKVKNAPELAWFNGRI